MIFRISNHVSQERAERMMLIIMNVGLGDEIMCVVSKESNRREVLTNSGVLLVLDENDLVITAYVPNFNKALVVWRSSGHAGQKMPVSLHQKIMSNKKYYEESKRIDGEFGYHKTKKGEYKFYRK